MGVLRLLLAVSVVLFHSNMKGVQFVGGGVAVESFFLISGFYMSLILDKKYTGVNGSYRLFITNRFLKIYPSYWTVLLLTVAMQLTAWACTGQPILAFYQLTHYKLDAGSIAFLSFANLGMFGQDLIGFMGLDKLSGALYFTPDFLRTYPFVFSFLFVPQGWSLAIELVFYLLAPWILRKKMFWTILLMCAVLALRVWLLDGLKLHYDPWIFRFFPSQLFFFLLGNMAYRLYLFTSKRIVINKTIVLVTLCIVAATTVCYPYVNDHLPKREAYYALVFLGLPILTNAQRLFRFDNTLGELSYPVYLVHMLVLTSFTTLQSQFSSLKALPVNLVTVVFSLIAGAMINAWVVQPVNRYRQSRIKQPVAA